MVRGFNKIELRILSISLMLMMFCAFLLSNERALNFFTLSFLDGQSVHVVKVVESHGDVRVRAKGALNWSKPKSELYLGDSVYVGDDAGIKLRWSENAEFEVPAKAIFRIGRIEGVPVVDMLAGQFKWHLSGEVGAGVKGAQAKILGKSAVIEIAVDPEAENHRIKVLAGEGSVEIAPGLTADKTQPPSVLPNPNTTYFYVWRLSDHYDLAENGLLRKEKPPVEVPVEIHLNWEHSSSGPFSIQLSTVEDLSSERRFYSTIDMSFTLSKAFLGDNFWRVGIGNSSWAPVEKFTVQARHLDSRPQPIQKSYQLNSQTNKSQLLKWKGEKELVAYIVEISSDSTFLDGGAELKWLEKPEFNYEFSRSGAVFVRMRGVNSRQELTDWSEVIKATLF